MKLLYFGTLEWGSTSLQRANSLRSLCSAFYGVDNRLLLPTYTERSWLTRISIRIAPPRLVRRHASLLLRETSKVQPDCVWIDQGLLLSLEGIEAIRRAGAKAVVHYTPDAIEAPGMGRVIRSAIPAYDLCITTKKADLPVYRDLGARQVLFSYQAFDPSVHRPLLPPFEGASEHQCDLVFVGQQMRERQSYLKRLVTALPSADLRIYGRGWDRANQNGCLGKAVRNRWLRGDDYAMALANARISLCFLNTEVGDEYTTRTFEIPACGSLMLAQRSETHEAMFQEGKEADFFSTSDELIEKATAWLADEPRRSLVAKAGHDKVISKDWSWRGRMKECLKQIQTILGK